MTERELMEKVTPGFVRWLMRYAPMFQLIEDSDRTGLMVIEYNGKPVIDLLGTPMFKRLVLFGMIGWNDSEDNVHYWVKMNAIDVSVHTAYGDKYASYPHENYSDIVTMFPMRCALLHCMMDIYSEVCATAPVLDAQ